MRYSSTKIIFTTVIHIRTLLVQCTATCLLNSIMYSLISLSLFVGFASAGISGEADQVIRKYSMLFKKCGQIKVCILIKALL